MLCQNCGKNEATTHVKRIINGEKAENHLCSQCASALGYGSMFSGFGINIGELFSGFFSDAPVSRLSNSVLRCEKCSSSFEDIAKSGKVGCADCYKTFFDKLLPSLQRIHGKTGHHGKFPMGAGDEVRYAHRLSELKAELNKAIDDQNFERAAQIRDEIRAMEG